MGVCLIDASSSEAEEGALGRAHTGDGPGCTRRGPESCMGSLAWRSLHRRRAVVGSSISVLVVSTSVLPVLLPPSHGDHRAATGICRAADTTPSPAGPSRVLVLLLERQGVLPNDPNVPGGLGQGSTEASMRAVPRHPDRALTAVPPKRIGTSASSEREERLRRTCQRKSGATICRLDRAPMPVVGTQQYVPIIFPFHYRT